MKRSRWERFLLILEPESISRVPSSPAVRRILEMHFGVWIALTILAAVKVGILGVLFGIFIGWLAMGRTRISSGLFNWWFNVVFYTILGLFGCIMMMVIP